MDKRALTHRLNTTIDESLPVEEVVRRKVEVDELVERLSDALRSNVKTTTHSRIALPSIDALRHAPDTWTDVSPISASALNDAAGYYLARPWMRDSFVEWCILGGCIFDAAARLKEAHLSGTNYGTINWAYIFSAGDQLKMVLYQAGFRLLRIILPIALWAVATFGLWYAGVSEWLIYSMFLIAAYLLYKLLPTTQVALPV